MLSIANDLSKYKYVTKSIDYSAMSETRCCTNWTIVNLLKSNLNVKAHLKCLKSAEYQHLHLFKYEYEVSIFIEKQIENIATAKTSRYSSVELKMMKWQILCTNLLPVYRNRGGQKTDFTAVSRYVDKFALICYLMSHGDR